MCHICVTRRLRFVFSSQVTKKGSNKKGHNFIKEGERLYSLGQEAKESIVLIHISFARFPFPFGFDAIYPRSHTFPLKLALFNMQM